MTFHDLAPPLRDNREQNPSNTAIPKIDRAALEFEKVPDTVPIPTYDTVEQFTIKDLDVVHPQWKEEGDDADLAAIRYARTNNLRAIGRQRDMGDYNLNYGGEGLVWALDHTPPEVGEQFDAHGLKNRQREGDLSNQQDVIGQFDTLLREGIDPNKIFYSMEFSHRNNGVDLGAEMPHTAGGLIVVGGRGEKIAKGGIKYVVTGEEYSSVLDILRNRYPEVTFVPWEDAPTFFTSQTNEVGTTRIPLEELVPSTPPAYAPVLEQSDLPGLGHNPPQLSPEAIELDKQRMREIEEARQQALKEADPEDAVWN